RWDRKRIMVLTNVLSAIVVGALAAVMLARGQAPSAIIFVAVFLLNSLNTFSGPAQASLMPEVVGRDLLATASGLFSTVGNVAALVGGALAGMVVAAVSGAWAVAGDAVSFLVAALSITVARLPARAIQTSSSSQEKGPSVLREIRDGWRAIAGQPVIRAI